MSNEEKVKAALEAALGHSPGYWAPGVGGLGWSFAVQNGGQRLVVNKLLGEAAKTRYWKHLPAVFEAAGLTVEILGSGAVEPGCV